MIQDAFIHVFSCSTGYYLYDVNSDLILKINEDTYNILKSDKQLEENEQIKPELFTAVYACIKSAVVAVTTTTQYLTLPEDSL